MWKIKKDASKLITQLGMHQKDNPAKSKNHLDKYKYFDN